MHVEADAERAAMLLVLRARLRRLSGQGGILEDLQEAERLVGDRQGTGRAEVADELARVYMLQPQPALAAAYAEEALALARGLRLSHVEASALCTLAALANTDGDIERSVQLFERARLLAEATHDEKVQVRVCINESDALEALGQHEQAAAAARRGGQLARVLGLARNSGVVCDGNLAESLYSLGRWDDALAVLDDADRIGQPAAYQAQFLWLRGSIALRRGDARHAAAQLSRAEALRPGHLSTDQEQALVRLKIEVAAAEGDSESALQQVMTALSAVRIARTLPGSRGRFSCSACVPAATSPRGRPPSAATTGWRGCAAASTGWTRSPPRWARPAWRWRRPG